VKKRISEFFHGIFSRYARKLPVQTHHLALYTLDVFNAVQVLDDLRSDSGNRLESLQGISKGFSSIHINF
jgi:plasmid maintenance system killer protein